MADAIRKASSSAVASAAPQGLRAPIKERRRATARNSRVPGFAPRKGEKRIQINGQGLTRSELVARFQPKVRFVAQKIAAGLPHNVEVDDLMSVGFIGLLDAADKFDAGRGFKFETYAEFRIRGAILDELRSQDWVPRKVRDKSKKIERIYYRLERDFQRKPTDEEMAHALGMTAEEFHQIRREMGNLSQVSLDNDRQVFAEVIELSPMGRDPFTETSKNEARAEIQKLFNDLPEKDRTIMNMYYYRGLSFSQIGAALSLTASRVCQIHNRALTRIRQTLKDQVGNAYHLFSVLLDE